MPGPSLGRTQAERRNESEEALLDAAAELIAERGVDRSSLARIGARAGSSRGLPTHHFGSKEALVARLARRAQDHVSETTLAALERGQGDIREVTALDLLQLTVDAYLGLFEHPTADLRALVVMWGSTFPTSSSVDGMLEADRRSYEGWAQLIERGQREGSIRADVDPGAGAVVLLGLLRGVAGLLLADSEMTDMSGVRRACHDWVVTSLTPPPSAPDGIAAKE